MKKTGGVAALVLLVCLIANCSVVNAENDDGLPKRPTGKMRNSIVRLGKRDDSGEVEAEAQPDLEMSAEIKRGHNLNSVQTPEALADQEGSLIWKNALLKRMLRTMYQPFALNAADETSVEQVPSWLENMANYRHTPREN